MKKKKIEAQMNIWYLLINMNSNNIARRRASKLDDSSEVI